MRMPSFFCSEVDRRVSSKACPVSIGVVDGLAQSAAMKTVHEVERSVKVAIDELRELDTPLGERILLRHRKSLELSQRRALADHGAEGFDKSWVGEPKSLGGLVKNEDVSCVLGPHKVGDCIDPPILSREIKNRDLDYIFTFRDRSEQRAFVKEWRRG